MSSKSPGLRVTAAALLPFWIAAGPAGALPARAQQGSAPAAESTLEIEHDPLPCLTTTTAPRIDANVNRESDLASGRVYWRVSNGPAAFYTSEMTRTGAHLETLLPRVTASADSIEYSIEVTDTEGRVRRTPSYVAPRVTSNCIPRGIVPLVSGLGLTIGLTEPRQPRIPAGVNAEDVAQVKLASGETVAVTPEDRRRAGAAPAEGASGAGKGGKGGISKGILIGAGVLAAGGIAAAAGGGGGGSSTSNPGGVGPSPTVTPTPTPTQPPSPTPTPTVPFRFVQAEATWSGPGDVDVLLLDASGSPVSGAQTVPAGCESTSARTERVLLQGSAVRAGNYQVRLTAKTCGAGTPTAISVLLTVQTDTQPKCPSAFVIVPVGQTVAGCSFTIP